MGRYPITILVAPLVLGLCRVPFSRAAPFAIIGRTFGAFGAVAVDHIRHIAICPGAPRGRPIINTGNQQATSHIGATHIGWGTAPTLPNVYMSILFMNEFLRGDEPER